MAYSPTPMDPANLPRWLQYEHEAIAREWLAANDFLFLRTLNGAPSKPRTGMIVYADGTNWNPGNGKGAYVFDGTTWRPMVANTESFVVACSDETTALTAGTAKVTFRMPYAFTLTSVKASLTTAQASGSIFTVDVNESGTSVLSTKLTIDNTEKTSATAATAAVISDAAIAADAEITIDIDQIGDGTAKGIKVTLIGYPT